MKRGSSGSPPEPRDSGPEAAPRVKQVRTGSLAPCCEVGSYGLAASWESSAGAPSLLPRPTASSHSGSLRLGCVKGPGS